MKKQFNVLNILTLAILIFFSLKLEAQTASKKTLRAGNDKYNNGNFTEAEDYYRKALEKNDKYFKAKYNLSNSLYKQKKYKEAGEGFNELSEMELNPSDKAKVLHNLGNTYLQQREWEKCIAAYKKSLKLNPTDKETKYNLSYAQKHLLQEQQQKNKNKNSKDKNQNKEQDKKDRKDNKDKNQDKNKQQNQQGDKDKQKNDNKKPEGAQPKEQKMSKQDAQRLLKAIAEKDKNTKNNLDKKKVKASKVTIEKDW